MLNSITDLPSLLTRPDLICTDAFVNGKWVQAKDGKTFDVINPARGDIIAQIADLSRVEVADAIHAAETARHVWACLLYTSPSPRDKRQSRMPSSA